MKPASEGCKIQIPLKVEDAYGICYLNDADGDEIAATYGFGPVRLSLALQMAKAVNNHDALVKALREIDAAVDGTTPASREVKDIAQAALAAVEGAK